MIKDTNGLITELICDLRVLGTPRPKGSKDALGRESSKYLKGYLEILRINAREKMQLVEMISGPVFLKIDFWFKRPKSHFINNDVSNGTKKAAPLYHTQKPDVDKLQRSVCDALTGECFGDDSQVIAVNAFKHWNNKTAGTSIQVYKAE